MALCGDVKSAAWPIGGGLPPASRGRQLWPWEEDSPGSSEKGKRCAGLEAILKDRTAKRGSLPDLGLPHPGAGEAGFPSSHWKMWPKRPEGRTGRPEPERQQLQPLDRE